MSYCPKKGKNVLVLSTMHSKNAINETTGHESWLVILFYKLVTIAAIKAFSFYKQENDAQIFILGW